MVTVLAQHSSTPGHILSWTISSTVYREYNFLNIEAKPVGKITLVHKL
jgi:hypothetical protein